MFPCRGKSASSQVTDLINNMAGSNYGMIWLDVETNPSSGCSWSGFSDASNCQYLVDLVNAVKSQGKTPGINSNFYMWESIMGGASQCQGLSSVPLWYAHYDGQSSFSNYRKFGGWSKPNIKQYIGDTTLCGAAVDINFY